MSHLAQTKHLQVYRNICDYDSQTAIFAWLNVELTGGTAGGLEVDLISVVVEVRSKLASTKIKIVVVQTIKACNITTGRK